MKVQHHILNGDALKEQFPTDKIDGHLIVCRECLIDGNIQGDSLMEFWDNRAEFIEKNYSLEVLESHAEGWKLYRIVNEK